MYSSQVSWYSCYYARKQPKSLSRIIFPSVIKSFVTFRQCCRTSNHHWFLLQYICNHQIQQLLPIYDRLWSCLCCLGYGFIWIVLKLAKEDVHQRIQLKMGTCKSCSDWNALLLLTVPTHKLSLIVSTSYQIHLRLAFLIGHGWGKLTLFFHPFYASFFSRQYSCNQY